MKKHKSLQWALSFESDGDRELFMQNRPDRWTGESVPPKVALFRTRKKARAFADARLNNPRVRVERVYVTVELAERCSCGKLNCSKMVVL